MVVYNDYSVYILHCSAPDTAAEYCDARVCCMSVCLHCVCLPGRISRKPHGQTSPHFLYNVAVATLRYVMYFRLCWMMFSYWTQWRHVATAATSCTGQPAWDWLRPVLDDGGRQDETSLSCKGYRGRSLRCTIASHCLSSSILR